MHAPIIGFLSSLTIAYFLLEINSINGLLNPIVPLSTTFLFQEINSLEIQILFLLENILLNTTISANVNFLLHYVTWGVGGLVSGVIMRNPKTGLFAGLICVLVGAIVTWFTQWYLIFGFEVESLHLVVNLTIIQNWLLGVWGAVFIAALLGSAGGYLVRPRR